jgi:hypothetical protein
MKTSLSRNAALVVAVIALVLSATGWAEAGRKAIAAQLAPGSTLRLDAHGKVPKSALPFTVSSKPRRGALLRLGKSKRFPASALPRRVPNAARLNGKAGSAYLSKCPEDSVEFGSWCLMSSVFPLDTKDVGKNDYFFASQTCAEVGGYLPTAAQLIGAADGLKLSSTLDDNPVTASVDEAPNNGLKDLREMSSTLVTTTAGSSASGSLGVTLGARGDPRSGEPDPVPVPADPSPSTLQYVTVFDNGNKGGFAGSKPVGQPERFRCAYNRTPGTQGVSVSKYQGASR